MVRQMISAVLVGVLLQISLPAQDQSQSPTQKLAEMQQVLRGAEQKQKAVNVALRKKIGNRKKLSGNVSNISETGFVIIDQKTGTPTTLTYADVHKVSQKGLSKGVQIVIGVGILAAVLGLVFIAIYPKT